MCVAVGGGGGGRPRGSRRLSGRVLSESRMCTVQFILPGVAWTFHFEDRDDTTNVTNTAGSRVRRQIGERRV